MDRLPACPVDFQVRHFEANGDAVLILNLEWSPETTLQAEDREAQHKTVEAILAEAAITLPAGRGPTGRHRETRSPGPTPDDLPKTKPQGTKRPARSPV